MPRCGCGEILNVSFVFEVVKNWIEKLVAIVALAWFVIFALRDTVHNFNAEDTIHYFAKQPVRMVWLAFIAIMGGLCAFLFDRLSARGKRSARLVALGVGASLMMLFAGFLIYITVSLFKLAREFPVETIPEKWFLFFILRPCGPIAVAIFLWFAFFRTLKIK